MRFSEETLMAYADGELDTETRAAVDAAMANDPDLADAVALQIENRQALQAKLHAAFDDALTEDVPARLLSAAQSADRRSSAAGAGVQERPSAPEHRDVSEGPPAIVDLNAAREAKRSTTARWSLPQWGAIAASLIVGVFVGRSVLNDNEGPLSVDNGRMTASAGLAQALSSQSGGAVDLETGIQIGVSYLAKNGDYCRTFTLRSREALAGLACRRDSRWAIDVLTPTKADASGAYRMAGAAVPALILGVVEDTMAGEPLDAEQEAEARERGWQR